MKKFLTQTWLIALVAFLLGIAVGGSAMRWHYKHPRAAPCGPITYYDNKGVNKLYVDDSCRQ